MDAVRARVTPVGQPSRGPVSADLLRAPIAPQAKRLVGAPGDRYEQQADRVAAENVPGVHKVENHLRRVPHPTLVLWTSDNPSTTWQEAEGAAGLLPRGQFHLLGDCAHWPQYEQAQEYNRLVASFLRD